MLFHHIEYGQLWVLRGPRAFDERTFTTTGLSSQTVMPDGSAPSAFTVTEGLATVKENVIIEPPNYYLYGGTRTLCNKVNPAQ